MRSWRCAGKRPNASTRRTRRAVRGNRGEASSGIVPEIWVGSLADYNAGVLHGVWLDATLEPDELAAAVQFMLRNSHEET